MKYGTCLFFCLSILISSIANADVVALSAKFRGGCVTTNTRGSCTISVTATGSDFGADGVVLRRSRTVNGPYRDVSVTPRALDDSGVTTFRFRNVAGCYRVYTAPNGNDLPDARSRTICEK